MSRTGDMAIEQQVRDEMAREAGPELAKALRMIARQAPSHFIGDAPVYHASQEIARAALKKAGLEP